MYSRAPSVLHYRRSLWDTTSPFKRDLPSLVKWAKLTGKTGFVKATKKGK